MGGGEGEEEGIGKIWVELRKERKIYRKRYVRFGWGQRRRRRDD